MRTVFGAVSFLGLLLFHNPLAAQIPSYSLQGLIVERGSSTVISGATVELSDQITILASRDGRFRFENVPEGRQTLTVRAMGYETRTVALSIRSDTLVQVELDVNPIHLDSLFVEAGTFTLRGRVSQEATGLRITEAHVQAGRTSEAFTRSDGSFRIRDLPRSYPITISVEAYRFIPIQLSIVSPRDTTIEIELEPDPVGIRLFENAGQQLEIRSRRVELSRVPMTRDFIEMRASSTLENLLRIRTGGRSTKCLFIDGVKQPFMDALATYRATEIELIEIYGRGAMIRIYTQDFVAKNLTRVHELPPIVWAHGICY